MTGIKLLAQGLSWWSRVKTLHFQYRGPRVLPDLGTIFPIPQLRPGASKLKSTGPAKRGAVG